MVSCPLILYHSTWNIIVWYYMFLLYLIFLSTLCHYQMVCRILVNSVIFDIIIQYHISLHDTILYKTMWYVLFKCIMFYYIQEYTLGHHHKSYCVTLHNIIIHSNCYCSELHAPELPHWVLCWIWGVWGCGIIAFCVIV